MRDESEGAPGTPCEGSTPRPRYQEGSQPAGQPVVMTAAPWFRHLGVHAHSRHLRTHPFSAIRHLVSVRLHGMGVPPDSWRAVRHPQAARRFPHPRGVAMLQ